MLKIYEVKNFHNLQIVIVDLGKGVVMFKRMFCLCIFLFLYLFVFVSVSLAAINHDFTPKWNVGDSWEVATRALMGGELALAGLEPYDERAGAPFTVHFAVTGLTEIDGEMCYVVKVTYKEPAIEKEKSAILELQVRQSDFTLKKVLDGGWEEGGGRDFIILDMPFNIDIPFDFPNFPATNTDEERTIASGTMTQKVTFSGDTVTVILVKKIGNQIYQTTQIWRKGQPWWSSAKRTYTYKEKTRVENNVLLIVPNKTDVTPPVLSVFVTPTTLWPPNHKMVEVTPTVNAIDDYDQYPVIKLESVTSNEPALTQGTGNTNPDIQINKPIWNAKQHKYIDKILLRAERSGTSSGRIYTINYSATDFSGNAITASATVTVPHDMEVEKKK
jgi:hypothetical protein